MRRFKVERETLLSSFTSAPLFQSAYADLIDHAIRAIVGTAKHPVALIALGGYGRREMAPFSDVDLLFFHAKPLDKRSRDFIEHVSKEIWGLGLKLSASTRSLEDCAEDMTADPLFLTGLLERRTIWGDAAALDRAFERFIKISSPAHNIAAKLAERDARHKKTGDTRYQLEPHVKDGKGALRDIHTLRWIEKFLGETGMTLDEAETLRRAEEFFQTVRCHLHLIAGRADDRLSFDRQPDVALRMGYKDSEPNLRAEKFMKDYFLMTRDVGHLTRVLCAHMEEEALKHAKKMVMEDVIEGFPVKNNRLMLVGDDVVRLFRVSQTSGLDIHPDALRKIRARRARALDGLETFLDILLDPKSAAQTLRRMNEADVLGTLIPPFKNIVAHMQYDMYHVFTADEHTIRAIDMMHRIENGDTLSLATNLFPQIHSRRALYAAMFLHDIAKGLGGTHAEKGADVARELCPRLGLSAEETETVAWLVAEHLLMTFTAFKRDLSDPKTIADFVASVQSPERLKLLTILTTADIMAVGPERWNNWKAGLISELYEKAMNALRGVETPARPRTRRKSDIEIEPKTHDDHTEVSISVPDRKGLFATLAGAMAAAGASIVSAEVYTDPDGTAHDVFHVQTLAGHVYENTAYLKKTIRAALDGKLDLSAEIRTRHRRKTPFDRAPRLTIDNNASASHTVIEISTTDRPGLLYDIASTLLKLNLQISAAKVTTFGTRAADVFYVRDAYGLKILHPDRLREIETALVN